MGAGYHGGFGNTKGSRVKSGVDYNTAKSKNVKGVNSVNVVKNIHKINTQSTPNSVTQNIYNGKLISERYYNERGDAYLDIDYTNHGNPKMHPKVPHEHPINSMKGVFKRKKEK
jgi:hypothetical protein